MCCVLFLFLLRFLNWNFWSKVGAEWGKIQLKFFFVKAKVVFFFVNYSNSEQITEI